MDKTTQLNVKIPASLKKQVQDRAKADGMTVTDWVIQKLTIALRFKT